MPSGLVRSLAARVVAPRSLTALLLAGAAPRLRRRRRSPTAASAGGGRSAGSTAVPAPVEAPYEVPPLASSAAAAARGSPGVARRARGAGRRGCPSRVAVEDKAMGTHVVLAAYTSDAVDEAALRGKLGKALDEIRRLEGLMTTWRDDSEVSRINAAAGESAVSPSAPRRWPSSRRACG